jgi:TolA-binding protein
MKSKMFTVLALISLLTENGLAQLPQKQKPDTVKIETLDLNKLQNIVTDIRTENTKLQGRLQTLEGTVTKDNLNKIVKQANIEKFKSDIKVLKKRYEAGENVLYHIIKETNQFNLSYKQLVLQSQFSLLVNPMTYPEFTTPLKTTLNSLKDKKPMPDIAQDLSNLSTTVPYLNNPIVNSGLSIVSYFIAKYNKKSEIDNLNFGKMMCVLNFISSAETEYKANVATVKSLSDKVDNYNRKLKDFFDLYLKSINYTAGYDAYIKAKTEQGNDFLSTTRDPFFNSILLDTTRIGIFNYSSDKDDNVAFYIEQVKFQLSEYESLLLDIENSINGYEKFTVGLASIANASCDGVRNTTKNTFTTITENVTGVKTAFNIVNKENKVPADQKRILFGL